MSDVIERLKKRIEARKWKITDDTFIPELIGMQYANNMNDWCLEIIDEELAKEPQVPQWIPCSERLPDTDDSGYAYVMVSMDDEFIATTEYVKGEGFSLWAESGEVIAWQPLPEPYDNK